MYVYIEEWISRCTKLYEIDYDTKKKERADD